LGYDDRKPDVVVLANRLPTVRYLVLLLSIALLAVVSAGPSAGARAATFPPLEIQGADGPVLQGDADCDAAVNGTDFSQVMRFAAGLGTSAQCIEERGDVNCDETRTRSIRCTSFATSPN